VSDIDDYCNGVAEALGLSHDAVLSGEATTDSAYLVRAEVAVERVTPNEVVRQMSPRHSAFNLLGDMESRVGQMRRAFDGTTPHKRRCHQAMEIVANRDGIADDVREALMTVLCGESEDVNDE